MADDEIRAVAQAICHAQTEGAGDWRAYSELATSIVAGIDGLAAHRATKTKAKKVEVEQAITAATTEIAAIPPEDRPVPAKVIIPEDDKVTSIRAKKAKDK